MLPFLLFPFSATPIPIPEAFPIGNKGCELGWLLLRVGALVAEFPTNADVTHSTHLLALLPSLAPLFFYLGYWTKIKLVCVPFDPNTGCMTRPGWLV